MRLAFFGSGEFALACFDSLLAAGYPPALVVTRAPRRRRRRGRPEPTAVHARAAKAGLSVHTPEDVNDPESLAVLRAARARLFAVVEYGQILRRALLDIPPLGSVNVHASLLPRHRGATPISAALLAGDTETGVTVQRVVRRLDAGPVLAARRVRIAPDDTHGSLSSRMAPLGGELLVEVVRAFASGRPPMEQPQDERLATVCRRHRPGDRTLDWSQAAVALERFIRAFAPRPGAHTRLLREPALGLTVLRAEVAGGEGEPGVVHRAGPEAIDVGTGEGLLRVLELVPAGKRAMCARDFLNGYRVVKGERFG